MHAKRKPAQVIKPSDCEQIFLDLIPVLANMRWAEMVDLAAEAEVTPQTIWNWGCGPVCSPRLNTLCRVARAMGYEVQLVKQKRPALRVVK